MSETIYTGKGTFNAGNQNQEYVLKVQKKFKFPRWIFFGIIPFIFLAILFIPVNQTIEITVNNTENKPLNNIMVEFSVVDAHTNQNITVTHATDLNGKAQFTVQKRRVYNMFFKKTDQITAIQINQQGYKPFLLCEKSSVLQKNKLTVKLEK